MLITILDIDNLGRQAIMISHDVALANFKYMTEGVYKASGLPTELQRHFLRSISEMRLDEIITNDTAFYLKMLEDGSLVIREPYDIESRWAGGAFHRQAT